MSVVVVSLHERDAPLEVFEAVTPAHDARAKQLAQLLDSPHLAEVALLSTCMRTEVYAVAERFHDGLADIVAYFESLVPGSSGIDEALQLAYDDAAARHLFEVAAGLDSAVLGEGEILRQVRDAAAFARREKALGPVLDGLFRHALSVGKRARSETAIARGITSFSHLGVELACQNLGADLSRRRVLVVGAGEVGQSVLRALRQREAAPQVIVANRNKTKARAALEDEVPVIGLNELGSELADSDVLICATASSTPLVDRSLVARAMENRSERPLLALDLAIPRDIDPAVGSLAGVRLVDLDELRRYADAQMSARRGEISSVLAIIDEELERYRVRARGRTMAPLITALRARAEQVVSEELARQSTRLEALDDQSRALLEAVTRRAVAKLLHEPTVQLKHAAGTARGERLSEALRTLFDL